MKLFDPEGPLMAALGKLADLVFCNILFCLCSLPIFTIGASLCALYDCTFSIVEDREASFIPRQFWRAFRRNFKQGTLLWLICLGCFGLLALYSAAVSLLTGTFGQVYRVTFLVLALLFLAGYQYIFPLQAAFPMNIRSVLKNAYLLSAAALPWTLCSLAITAGAVYISFFMNPNAWGMAFFLWAVAGIAVVAYLNSFFFRQAFKRIVRDEKT